MKLLSRAQWAMAAALTAACLWLHLDFFLHAGPLWRDEWGTVALSTRLPWGALWSGTDKDFFPALYFFLVRSWIRVFGDGEAGLRVPGLLIGVSSVALLWLHAKVLKAGPPLLSLLLFGLSPLAVRSLDYLRPYGLGVVLLLAVSILFWDLAEEASMRKAAAAALAAAVALRVFYQAAFFILAFCFSGIALSLHRKDKRSAALILGAGFAAALTLIPEAAGIVGVRREQLICRSPDNFASVWGALSGAFGQPWPSCVWLWWAPAILGLGKAWGDRRAAYFSLSWVVAVPLTFFSLKTSGMAVQSHYFLPLMSLMAVSMDVSWGPALRWVAVMLSAGALFVLFPRSAAEVKARQTNLDQVASRIEAEADQKDLVVVNPWHFGITFQRYYRGKTPWVTIPPLETGDDFKIQNYRPVQEIMSRPGLMEPVLARMSDALKSGHRVWIVGGLDYAPVPPDPPAGAFIGPYYWFWSAQAGHLASRHAGRIRQAPGAPPGSVNRLENVGLDVAEGWRD